jgi:rRNA maturation RNase YbeY
MLAPFQLQKRKGNRISLRIAITAQCGTAYAGFLRSKVRLAHGRLKSPLSELSMALVGDRQMSELHERFMSIPGPTDVLTFPIELDKKGLAISGEIVICVPEARRRAPEQGNSLSNELLLYAVHGLLHLCGYDDRTAREFEIMHRTEDDLLCDLGIGPLFGPLRSTASAEKRLQPSDAGSEVLRRAGSKADKSPTSQVSLDASAKAPRRRKVN